MWIIAGRPATLSKLLIFADLSNIKHWEIYHLHGAADRTHPWAVDHLLPAKAMLFIVVSSTLASPCLHGVAADS